MANSTHKVEIVPVKLEPHPNADSLSIAHVWGYTVCVKTEDWKDKELGAYIPPDSIVPETPEFAFLAGHYRIRVRRYRGILSQGLLVPAPAGSKLGDDVAAQMGITHYEPPLPLGSGGSFELPPEGYRPKYDVDTYYRFPDIFKDGEIVYVSEKIHGANARFCWQDNRLWCGSRTNWISDSETNIYWLAAAQNPWILDVCKANPDLTFYTEVYGAQSLKYGRNSRRLGIAVFDILFKNTWMSFTELTKFSGKFHTVEMVPEIYTGPFSKVLVQELSSGPSLIPGANHYREGIVVKPIAERTDPQVGRVILKVVSNEFLEKDK